MNKSQFLNNINNFLQIIHRAVKENTWKTENYNTAFSWAEYVEKYLEFVSEDEENFVDNQLEKINVPVHGKIHNFYLIEIDLKLSCHTLSCSKHLLLRSLLYNPFIEKSLLSRVLSDFLRLGDGSDEDVKIARERAKKTLIGDVDKRVSKVKKVHLLYRIVHSLSLSLLGNKSATINSLLKDKRKEILNYTFLPKFLSKKTFAKLLKKRCISLINRNNHDFDEFKNQLYNHAQYNVDNLEILCLIPIVSISNEGNDSKPETAKIELSFFNLLLENSENSSLSENQPILWTVHPWVLTELSFLDARFYSKYISFIIYRIGNLLSSFPELNNPVQLNQFDEDLENIQNRLFYIIHRSSEMKIICTQVLKQFMESPLFQIYSRLVPKHFLFFQNIII